MIIIDKLQIENVLKYEKLKYVVHGGTGKIVVMTIDKIAYVQIS